MDKWQEKWHPYTDRPDYVDGETGSSMERALYVDDYGLKAGLITLKEVDSANASYCSGTTARYSSLAGECYPYNGLTGCGRRQ